MLSDDLLADLEDHVDACDAARIALESALDDAETLGPDTSPDARTDVLQAVADALGNWRDAQRQFMDAVEHGDVPNAQMAALFLKNDADVDASNARRGLPGAHVDGADQPFDVDLSGTRGQALTTAAMEYLDE